MPVSPDGFGSAKARWKARAQHPDRRRPNAYIYFTIQEQNWEQARPW
jgi:hypothetical protein